MLVNPAFGFPERSRLTPEQTAAAKGPIGAFITSLGGDQGRSSRYPVLRHRGFASREGVRFRAAIDRCRDSPGDLKAARANGFLFFPINPGHEEECWQLLLDEGLERFFQGRFAGDYEKGLIDEFEKLLPDTPPWKRR